MPFPFATPQPLVGHAVATDLRDHRLVIPASIAGNRPSPWRQESDTRASSP